MFDEIWDPSEFIKEALAKKITVPVVTMPYGIQANTDEAYTRNYFNLPEDKFIFFYIYDSFSSTERKNPEGTIDDFQRAFSRDDSKVALVIKVKNSSDEEIASIRKLIAGWENIVIYNCVLDKIQINSLIACSDVFVSLHRSEGFGLVPAEAMLLGKPVIATNWSGNTDFMNEQNSCLVEYTFVNVKDGYYNMLFENRVKLRYAEANIDHATKYMQRLYQDKEYYNVKSLAAKKCILENNTIGCAGQRIDSRLKELGLLQ